jgi:hypothetical protein
MAHFSNGVDDKYLDRNGLDYLVQELIKKIGTNESVDLSNYYTKEQVDGLTSPLEAKFSINFETGQLEYESSNADFWVNYETGELEYERRKFA